MIFISYSRADGRALADGLYQALLIRGFPVWRDERSIDPYADFSAEIERALQSSTHMLVCITPRTARTDAFMRREIVYAQRVGVSIIPFLDKGVDAVDIPATISHLTWIDGS